MKKKILVLSLCLFAGTILQAQNTDETSFYTQQNLSIQEPFLFSTTALTPEDLPWTINYSGSYGEEVSGPFGYDGVGQQIALKGYLGSRLTFYANVALGIPRDGNTITSAQQAEVIRNFIGGKKNTGLRLGWGVGMSRDFSSVYSLRSRATASFDSFRWKLGGNLLFEKALSSGRDKIDVITSMGVQYRLTGNLFGGVEAIGEDLEGLWDEEEAEGGAKIMVGPSVNLAPSRSRFAFSVSGGPVMYVTRSTITNPNAIRELPSENGLTLRARVIYNLSGISLFGE